MAGAEQRLDFELTKGSHTGVSWGICCEYFEQDQPR